MRFKVGDIVYNETFGLGKVLGITEYGKDNYLNIRFHTPRQSGIQSIRENDNSVFSTILYEAVKEIKNRDNVTISDIREFIRQRFNNALINKTCAISDDVRTFCEEFSLNESFIIDCIKKNNQENLSKKIKLELKEGYISLKDLENLYEDNKLIVDYASLEDLIKQHNVEFMKNEVQKYPDVFVTKKKEPLNEEQNLAVVSDEDNCLVIAGAGCGKTSMLLGKIKYLLQKGVPTYKILVLSYTNKTVEEFNNSLKGMDIPLEARTFHSLGAEIVGGGYNDNITIGNILRQILFPERKKDDAVNIRNIKNLFEKIKKLFLGILAYANDYKNDITVDKIHKYALDNYEAQSFPTLKAEIEYHKKNDQTIHGERVKSLAEVEIANFLFLNEIEYEYEKTYDKPYYGSKTTNKQYKPDFYIKNGDDEIWLEHFGVTTDEQGIKHASWCKDEAKYLRQMEEKIKTHGDHLIYTTSDMLHDGTLLTELEKKLIAKGIRLKPINDDKIREYLNKLREMSRYEALIKRIERAINLFKSQRRIKSISEWREKVLSIIPDIYRSSTINLFEIIAKIHELYKQTLADYKCIDFSDMISDAIDKLKQKPTEYAYDYILIDEYQDITNIRYEFIKALKKVSNAKIMAVGDDWQSIYGFSGSDIALFTQFRELFNNANELYITKTYRNSQQLLDITQNFIERNTFQKKKKLHSYPGDDEHPIKAILYHPDKEKIKDVKDALMLALDTIIKKRQENETICIIGRYNPNTRDTYYLSKDENNELYYIDNDGYRICYQGECFDFSTIHKAKGLEWDYTIFLDGMFEENEKKSFPCTISDDDIVKPLLYRTDTDTGTDTYPYAEERRMLYVALTRCKKQCYWLVSEKRPTPFYEEMSDKIKIINDTLEKYCKKTGQKSCPICKRGILVKRKNRESGSEFLGCTNFPPCRHTESLETNTKKTEEVY